MIAIDWQHPKIKALKAPFWLVVANAFIAQIAGAGMGLSPFLLVLPAAMFWAGWRMNRELWGSRMAAAVVGPILFTVGLVLVGGTLQVLFGDFSSASAAASGSWAEDWPRLAYWLGLVIASVLVSPVCVMISLSGGILSEFF